MLSKFSSQTGLGHGNHGLNFSPCCPLVTHCAINWAVSTAAASMVNNASMRCGSYINRVYRSVPAQDLYAHRAYCARKVKRRQFTGRV